MGEPAPVVPAPFVFVDGAVRPRDEAAVLAHDSAFALGRGCYTTTRWNGVEALHVERHVQRLARDAAAVGVGPLDAALARRAFEELGHAAFGPSEGVLRLQASRDAAGRRHLTGVPRALGPAQPVWRAIVAPFPHPGAMPWGGAKVSNHLLYVLAGDAAAAAGCDEALLVDREGRLVEGSRSALVVVDASGVALTPDPALGAVASVALEVVRERAPELCVRRPTLRALARARELICLNAVRGARPVVELDGRPVGNGTPGPVARALDERLRA